MRSRPIALVYCILSAFLPSARTTERIEPLADHADDGVEVSFDARNVTRTSGLWGSTMLDLLNPLVRPEDNHYNGPSIYGALHADKRGVWTVGNRASSGLGLRFKINDGGSSTAALFLMKTDMRFETYFDTMNSSLVTISRTDRLETSRIRYVIEENSKFYVSEPSRDFTNDSKASGRSKHSFTIDALKTKWFKFHPARNVELLKQIGEKKVPAFQNIGFVGILLYAKVLRGPVNFGIEKLSISGKSIVSARVENSTVSIPSESLTSAPSDTNISVPTEMPVSAH